MIDETEERHYNARAAVPDFQDYLDRWPRASAELRGTADCRLDIPYGASDRQRFDFFPCPTRRRAPLMMFIHGGYWQGLDKSMFSFVAAAYIKAGIAVAVVGYDLCPLVTVEDIGGQMIAAVAALRHQADDLGFDHQRLYVAGHSAGGHLTAIVMAAVEISGGVSLSGLFDLAPLINTSINDKLGLDEAAARQSSPLFKEPLGDGPLLLAVGSDESAGFHGQSDRLAEAWGPRCRRLHVSDRNHFSIVDDMADETSDLSAAVRRLVLESHP